MRPSEWVEVWEQYEDAQRRWRYCVAKLGKNRGGECKLRSRLLIEQLEQEYRLSDAYVQTARRLMEEEVQYHPCWADWLQHVKGVGPVYAFRLIGAWEALTPVSTIANPSQAWRLAGIGIKGGKPQAGLRRQGGSAYSGYYPLRRVLGEMAVSIIRLGSGSGSFYRAFYDGQRRRYGDTSKDGLFEQPADAVYNYLHAYYQMREADPAWQVSDEKLAKIKAHSAAALDMKRLIISHLWACWRETHGLSVPPSYGAAFGGHYDIPWRDAVRAELLMRGAR